MKRNNRKGAGNKKRRRKSNRRWGKERKAGVVGGGWWRVGAGTGNVLESISRVLWSVSCIRHTGFINKKVWVCVCVCPETCINHAGDEQMKSMIPKTSSEINSRDHVRDVSSNWHQSSHPSWAGVQDPFLVGLPVTQMQPQALSLLLQPYHWLCLLSWKGKICNISLSQLQPASWGVLLPSLHTFSICFETFTPVFSFCFCLFLKYLLMY